LIRIKGGSAMPSNTLAAAVLATGIWVIFAFAAILGLMHGSNGNVSVATGSDKVMPKVAAAR
jgi:hypothetical protein